MQRRIFLWMIGTGTAGAAVCAGVAAQDGFKPLFDGQTLAGWHKEKVFGILGREGSTGLQVHGGKGWSKGAKCRWRNLRIKRR